MSTTVSILITRQRARALAEQIEAQETSAFGGLPELPVTPREPSLPREKKTFFQSLRSIRRSVSRAHTEVQEPNIVPENVIPTPSEDLELSFCMGDHSTDSENEEGSYEEVVPNIENVTERSYQNAEQNSEFRALDPGQEESSVDSLDEDSLVPSEEMNDQVSRLCEAIERMRATYDSQPSSTTTVKPSVAFPVFRGEECEDVHEFVSNYKRAARLNGWSGVNLALGLPLYLKGHASAWFKTLESPDEMSFDELSAALIHHFASGASEWRVRQALGQRRQLEKESVADYSYMIWAEVQQQMGTSLGNTTSFRQRPAQNFPTRGFRTRTGDPVCFNCGRRGHTYYNCRANPDPRVPRYNRGRQSNYYRQRQGQNNLSWNSKQGN